MCFRTAAVAAFALGLVLCINCGDDSPTAPSIRPSDIVGDWYATLYVSSWDITEDGNRDQGQETDSVTDTSEIVVIDSQNISWYAPEFVCFTVTRAPYVLSKFSLLGEYFSGSDSDSTGTVRWYTTVSTSSDQLIVTMTYRGTMDGVSGWEKTVIHHSRYSGPIPPGSWPQSPCDMTLTKSRLPESRRLGKFRYH